MTGNSAIRWLLGLERVPADATAVRLGWEHPVPAWASAAMVAAAIAFAWLSYRRIALATGHRRTLVALRSATFTLLAALLAGPVLEVPRESIDPDSVIVLADRSRSMSVEDVSVAGGRLSRDAALRRLASADGPFSSVGEEHRVEWLAFADGVTPLRAGPDGIDSATRWATARCSPPPSSARSSVRRAVRSPPSSCSPTDGPRRPRTGRWCAACSPRGSPCRRSRSVRPSRSGTHPS